MGGVMQEEDESWRHMIVQHLARPLAIKSLDGDGHFTGYASVFGALDSQREIVERGAFVRSITRWRALGRSPAMLWMHDPTMPIGVWISMQEDENGLFVSGRLALSTQKGREAYELLKLGALTGLSIGYRVIRSEIDKVRKARLLRDVELFEISLVTFPANDEARISDVKSPRTVARRKQEVGKPRIKRGVTDKEKTRAVVARLHKAASTLKQKQTRR